MLSDEQRKSLELAVTQYEQDLEEVLPYLLKRGIDSATARSRRLGFVKAPAIPEHKRAKGRLAIPFVTPAGVVAMAFRCVEDHNCKEEDRRVKAINKSWSHSKYWKPYGQVAHLYGVNDLHLPVRDICVVEGEIDAITLSELCKVPGVGIGGAEHWQTWWPLILVDYRHVYAICDGDAAGRNLGNKIVKEMRSKAVLIELPEGEDVNSYYLKHGADKLRSLIQ